MYSRKELQSKAITLLLDSIAPAPIANWAAACTGVAGPEERLLWICICSCRR